MAVDRVLARLRQPRWALLLAPGFLVLALAWYLAACPLSAVVRDAETGQPLAGATVTLAGRRLTSDARGALPLRGLRGVQMVRAEAPGYRSYSGPLFPGGFLAALCLAPVELRGTVVDAASGEPIAGATVRVGESEVRSDGQGRYVARRVLPGSSVSARARHYRESEPLSYTGQARQDIALALLPATVVVQDLCTGAPLAGVTVSAAGQTRQSDAQGQASFEGLPPQTEVLAEGDGWEARGRTNPGERTVLGMRTAVLSGIVRTAEGQPLPRALVLARAPGEEPSLTYTGADGSYRLEAAPADARLLVRAAGYERAEQPAKAGVCHDFSLQPFTARGIYLAFHMLSPSYRDALQANLDLVSRSDLNTVVIEVKTEGGQLAFEPQLPLAREIGAGAKDVTDLRKLVADLHRRGIYCIARMPVFEDDLLGTRRPEWAVHRPDGGVWRAAGGRAWVDPFRREVWDYNIALAKEAVALGFDEIQFDYVRFPSDGATGDCRYVRESNAQSRVEAITTFVALARQELDGTGAFLSADLFGLTAFESDEMGVGQLLDKVAEHLDYVSPMIYPSTYVPGMLGLPDPWRSPYEVVKLSLDEAHKKTSTLIRPWLQHFDDYNGTGYQYGLREITVQIQAAQDGRANGWLFWNVAGEYNTQAFGSGQ